MHKGDKMTIKTKIIELLMEEKLTSLEILEKLQIPKDNLFSYLSTLRKEKKIIAVNNKRPFKYRANTPIAYLKFLNDFFKENIGYLIKNPKIDKFIELNAEKFNLIEEIIKNA